MAASHTWLHPLLSGELTRRDAAIAELMDDPACDRAALDATYAQFGIINTVVSGWRSTYRRLIRPLLSTTLPTRLLDIGSGGGDLAVQLAAWARRDGLRLHVVAADPDPRADAFARSRGAQTGVEFRRALSSDLVAEGERFDLVVSNHLLHHLDAAALGALLSDSERLAPRAVHADITRSALAYAGFGILTAPFFHGSFIRADGLTSIRRSHRPEELAPYLPGQWRVRAASPFRYLLTRGGFGDG
ncbi:methyltransferase domain-containing protein [Rathayibacter sp. YIM 133350]|uniref:methyltransferase domain-containing protein n=1 Tax=Rathayibacter sp. YIM 133350 TaxID=3131992 RepID=UPI00307DCE06